MVKCSVQIESYAQKPVSHVILYPDGIYRVLTMLPYQWEWVTEAERNGYAFNDILREAMGLAVDFPSGKGFHFDVVDCTRYMLMTINRIIYEVGIVITRCR